MGRLAGDQTNKHPMKKMWVSHPSMVVGWWVLVPVADTICHGHDAGPECQRCNDDPVQRIKTLEIKIKEENPSIKSTRQMRTQVDTTQRKKPKQTINKN
jgi:hypothetical protein